MTVRVYSLAPVAAPDAPPAVRVYSVAATAVPEAPARVRFYSIAATAAAESTPPDGQRYLWVDADGSVRVARWAQKFGTGIVYLDGLP